MKTMMTALVIFGICSLPLASSYIAGRSIYNTDNMSKVLRACARELLALTTCLEKDRSIIFKLETCENILAQTFMCMSNKQNAAHAQLIDDSSDVMAHAQLIDDSSDVMAHAQQLIDDSSDVMEMKDQPVVQKRGLGRCIHRCLQGQGRMNFIQCKSMCHR